MKKQIILIVLASIALLAGCAPTFPIQALKKGEWGGSASFLAWQHTVSLTGSLGYGLSDKATAYVSVSNLAQYRLGLYYAATHRKGITPELGVNLFGGVGSYAWLAKDPNPVMVPFPQLSGNLKLAYGGLGLHSLWQVDSKGTLLYVVVNNFYQSNVGYAVRPGVGVAFPVTDGGTLFQIDVQTPFLSPVQEKSWQELKTHYAISMGLTF